MHNPSDAELRAAFEAQGLKLAELASRGPRERRESLKALRAAVVSRKAELADALHADFRKPPRETFLTELVPTIDELDYALRHVGSWMRDRRAGPHFPFLAQRPFIRREPLGRALIFSPWNYPFHLAMTPLVAAIAAGDAVFLKPSDKTPRVAELIERVAAEALPPDELVVVRGPGASVGDRLLALPFDHVFFTGSPSVGAGIAAKAAAVHASVTLELGGKSPAVVLPDADLAAAAASLAWGKALNAGQTCIAPDYVLAPEGLAEELASLIGKRWDAMYGATGEARRASPDLARIVDEKSAERIAADLAESVRMGARIAYGGAAEPAERYLEPTVVLGARPEMPLMRREIFGPVLPVVSYTDAEEAIAYVRGGPKPLALYAFGRDKAALRRVIAGTSSGGALVNNVILQVANPKLPFGGVGMSGTGAYHGERGFLEFSHERAVVYDAWPRLTGLIAAPYGADGPAARALKAISRLKRLG